MKNQYRLRRLWINFIDLQHLELSYTAIGIYVCLTANKTQEFGLEDLAMAHNPNTVEEIEFAIEELLAQGLIEIALQQVQGGVA